MLREIVKGGSLILLSVIFSKLLSLLYIPVLARVLGPEGLGLYNLALTMLPWFVTLISLSLSTIVAQTVAEHTKQKDRLPIIISTYAFFTLLLSLFGGLLHFFFARTIALDFFQTPELVGYLQLVSLGIAFAIFYNTIIGIARGLKDFKLYFQMEVFKSFMFVALGLLFLLIFRYGVEGALFALVISPLFPILHLIWKHRRYFGSVLKLDVVFTGLRTGIWITLISLLLTILVTVDRFLLGRYTDPHTVGLYAAVTTLITAISLIASSFKGSILPFVSENFVNKEHIRTTVEKVISYTLLLIGFCLLGLVAFRQEIILLAFGKDFLPSIPLVPLLGLTLLPFTIYILTHTVILDRRLVGSATRRLFPVWVLALVIDFLLIKRFTVYGAAAGLFISHSLISVTFLQLLRKKFDLKIRRLFGLCFLIIFLVFVALFLPSSLWYKIPLFLLLLLIYFIFLWSFRFVTQREIDIVLTRLNVFFTRFRQT